MARINVPTDAEIRAMSDDALDELARRLDKLGRERLSETLLRIHGQLGRHAGTYADSPTDWHRRRIVGHEINVEDVDTNFCVPVVISERAIWSMMRRAARAELTERQRAVWILHEAGLSQKVIAERLEIRQQSVSKLLTRALDKLWSCVSSSSKRIFREESHRAAYFPPKHRPSLPVWLDAARSLIESIPGFTTHIQEDAYRKIEIWRDDKLLYVERNGKSVPAVATYAQIRLVARKLKKNFGAEVVFCHFSHMSNMGVTKPSTKVAP